MTFVKETFALSPKSQLEPSGEDPITVTYTPAMVGHGQDTTPEESTDYSVLIEGSVDHAKLFRSFLHNYVDT